MNLDPSGNSDISRNLDPGPAQQGQAVHVFCTPHLHRSELGLPVRGLLRQGLAVHQILSHAGKNLNLYLNLQLVQLPACLTAPGHLCLRLHLYVLSVNMNDLNVNLMTVSGGPHRKHCLRNAPIPAKYLQTTCRFAGTCHHIHQHLCLPRNLL